MVPVKSLGELRGYSGCFYERDGEKGVLKISQQTFPKKLLDEYGIGFGVFSFLLARDLRSSTRTKNKEVAVSRVGRFTGVALNPD